MCRSTSLPATSQSLLKQVCIVFARSWLTQYAEICLLKPCCSFYLNISALTLSVKSRLKPQFIFAVMYQAICCTFPICRKSTHSVRRSAFPRRYIRIFRRHIYQVLFPCLPLRICCTLYLYRC